MPSPVPVGPSPWTFPPASQADEHGVVAIGGDLDPETLISAYRQGLFPMPISEHPEVIGWWSPPERGILKLADLLVSRSLRRSCRRYDVTLNAAFDQVIETCASQDRPGRWISPGIVAAYRRLHRLGWVHSVEVWEGDELAGGLYGVQVAGLFAGESMFHSRPDGSKVALVALVAALEAVGATLLDVQWSTPHLASLGVVEVTRRDYFTQLDEALASSAQSIATSPDLSWAAKFASTP